MKGQAVTALLSMICALSAIGAQVEVPIVAPDPEECQACAVADLSQRTRFADKEGTRQGLTLGHARSCWPTITWTNDYHPDRFVRPCGNAGYVTVSLKAANRGQRGA